MKKTLTGLLSAILLVSAIGCTAAEKEETLIYEHERLYEQYKQDHSNDWEEIPRTNYESKRLLLGTDKFNVSVNMFSTNSHTSPQISIYELSTKYTKIINLDSDFYAYNSNGEEIAKLVSGSTIPGYYNPFEKDWEPYCWYKVYDEKIEIKMLAEEMFFVGEAHMPWAMTEEDYQMITAKIKARENEDQFEYWDIMVGDWIAIESNLELLGLQNIVDRDVFNEGIHVLKGGVDYPHMTLEDIIELTGITTNQKRIIESKVLKKDYVANMAMITMTIDLSGASPKVDFAYDIISPTESDIAEIYFGGKDYDLNKELADIFG